MQFFCHLSAKIRLFFINGKVFFSRIYKYPDIGLCMNRIPLIPVLRKYFRIYVIIVFFSTAISLAQ